MNSSPLEGVGDVFSSLVLSLLLLSRYCNVTGGHSNVTVGVAPTRFLLDSSLFSGFFPEATLTFGVGVERGLPVLPIVYRVTTLVDVAVTRNVTPGVSNVTGNVTHQSGTFERPESVPDDLGDGPHPKRDRLDRGQRRAVVMTGREHRSRTQWPTSDGSIVAIFGESKFPTCILIQGRPI